MDFPFVFFERRGDVVITSYEGDAHIEQCATDRDEWNLTGISLHGWRPGRHGFTKVALDANDKQDKLYERIALWLLGTKSQEISDAWDAHQRETADDHEEAA